jgi:hypothetical protein
MERMWTLFRFVIARLYFVNKIGSDREPLSSLRGA